MGMTINTNKMKVMIIKSKKITYANFVYDNNNLEEVTSYKYLEIILKFGATTSLENHGER
jgi:hypothetical protein